MMGWRKQRRVRSTQFFMLLLIALFMTAVAKEEVVASSFGRYHALVIGNQDYKYLQDLKTPLSDAQEIARILQDKYGFEVTVLLDATREKILRALRKLRRIKEEDNLLIYYAGHGILGSHPVECWRSITTVVNSSFSIHL